jgi:peptide/nickel transport system permease protein
MSRGKVYLSFFLNKLLLGFFVMLLLSLLIFLILNAAPGSYAQSGIAKGLSKERIEILNRIYGYDIPVYKRYFSWISSAIRGDFGISFMYKKPVTEIIGKGLVNSFSISFLALIIELVVAIPLGVLSAVKKGKVFDKFSSIIAICFISFPLFFAGILLKKWFAFDLRWFPSSGGGTIGVDLNGIYQFFDWIKHLILPALTLSLGNIGVLTRYIRNLLHDELSKGYITAARLRWVPEKRVIWVHAFGNIKFPIITHVLSLIPLLFSGTVIVESLYGIFGIGSIAYSAALSRDYPLLMGFTIMITFIIIAVNILTDFLYLVLDERISLKG